MLSDQQKRDFSDRGYLVLPGFKHGEAIAAVRARANAIVAAFDPAGSHAILGRLDRKTTLRLAAVFFLAMLAGIAFGAHAEDDAVARDTAITHTPDFVRFGVEYREALR